MILRLTVASEGGDDLPTRRDERVTDREGDKLRKHADGRGK